MVGLVQNGRRFGESNKIAVGRENNGLMDETHTTDYHGLSRWTSGSGLVEWGGVVHCWIVAALHLDAAADDKMSKGGVEKE